MSNRKDDHIELALKQEFAPNDFDQVRLIHPSIVSTNINDVSLEVDLLGNKFTNPIYINAMSGGSEQSKVLNQKLAILARECRLAMACGSVSAALKDPKWIPSYTIIRQEYPDGFLFANIGLNKTVHDAQLAVNLLQANALQLHLNAAQEITMPEGDRSFSHWPNRIHEIVQSVNVPVILKEVGFGMSIETAILAQNLGVSALDVSGKGGTNFIRIENDRRPQQISNFDSFGLSTVESLLEMRDSSTLPIFASGGIRGAYDIVKAFALGAKMVGLSGYFLKLVTHHSIDEAIHLTKQLLYDIKAILAIYNVKMVHEATQIPKVISPTLSHYLSQRKK